MNPDEVARYDEAVQILAAIDEFQNCVKAVLAQQVIPSEIVAFTRRAYGLDVETVDVLHLTVSGSAPNFPLDVRYVGGLLCSAANRRRFSAATQLHRKGLSHATGPIQPSSFMAAARAAAPLGSASV